MVLDVPHQVNDSLYIKRALCAIIETLYLLVYSDLQKKFPIDNLAEWNNGHPLGLRTVHAYVLVFDMSNLDTFQVNV